MIKINITTHSGESDILEVEEFNAKELADMLNDNDVQSIPVGGNVYSRIDIRNVRVVTEESEEL